MATHEENMNGFLSAMGQEFARVLQSVAGGEGLCGADVYTVVTRTLPASQLSPELLAGITDDQAEELRAGFVRFLEVADNAVTMEQIRMAIARISVRWPVSPNGAQ
jgi:hypothetical protein